MLSQTLWSTSAINIFFTMRSCIWLLVLGVNLVVAEENSGRRAENVITSDKQSFIDSLVSNMTVEDLG